MIDHVARDSDTGIHHRHRVRQVVAAHGHGGAYLRDTKIGAGERRHADAGVVARQRVRRRARDPGDVGQRAEHVGRYRHGVIEVRTPARRDVPQVGVRHHRPDGRHARREQVVVDQIAGSAEPGVHHPHRVGQVAAAFGHRGTGLDHAQIRLVGRSHRRHPRIELIARVRVGRRGRHPRRVGQRTDCIGRYRHGVVETRARAVGQVPQVGVRHRRSHRRHPVRKQVPVNHVARNTRAKVPDLHGIAELLAEVRHGIAGLRHAEIRADQRGHPRAGLVARQRIRRRALHPRRVGQRSERIGRHRDRVRVARTPAAGDIPQIGIRRHLPHRCHTGRKRVPVDHVGGLANPRVGDGHGIRQVAAAHGHGVARLEYPQIRANKRGDTCAGLVSGQCVPRVGRYPGDVGQRAERIGGHRHGVRKTRTPTGRHIPQAGVRHNRAYGHHALREEVPVDHVACDANTGIHYRHRV